jgi:multiple sugar transport system substrate-binding protein
VVDQPRPSGLRQPAEGEIFDTYVITDMFAKAATGALSPKDAMVEASGRAKEIFAKWRKKGMVGGRSKDT